MKKRHALLAVPAVGLVLSHGAQATVLTFDSLPAGQSSNSAINPGFGSNASADSAGVSTSNGATPNIALTWGFTPVPGGSGGGGDNVEWDYYIFGPWSAAQLNNSKVDNNTTTVPPTTTPHELTFTPDPGFGVTINSFNFHPYYNTGSAEHYDYTWNVTDGVNVLSTGNVGFDSDATKNHPVDINFSGLVGQSLVLEVLRTGGTGLPFNIAADDISFNQFVPEPAGIGMLSLGLFGLLARRRRQRDPG